MADAIEDDITRYAERYTSAESPLLQRINRETNTQVSHPNMISGHLQGRLLSMISHLVRPHNILEIGTFTGYSALCLAEGLQENGILHTIDNNDELAERCRTYFEQSGAGEKIILHTGEALDIIPGLDGPFDLVFIDADKPNYEKYFDLVIEKVRSGGIIMADNVLYHGEVLLSPQQRSNNAKAISAFNRKIASLTTVDHLLLTVRDGLFIMRKK